MGGRLGTLGMLAAALVGCGESGDLPNAQSIETYTEENDPNKLLGRPGQYVGKANFRDRRAESDGAKGLDVSEGGSIEVFASEDEADKRTAYVEAIGQSGVGPFAEYDYRRGQVLLRVAGGLTPKQARQYEAALEKVAP